MMEKNCKQPDDKRVGNLTSQTVFKESQPPDDQLTKETSLGVPENIAGSLTYLFGFISGFVMILGERENGFVRYHALQSIYISVAFCSAYLLLGIIPVVSWFSNVFMVPLGLILWLALMLNAYKGNLSLKCNLIKLGN